MKNDTRAYRQVYVHLLNDYSGSPKVLNEAIKAMATDRNSAKLYLGSFCDGALSNCQIPITTYWYRRSTYRILTFFSYFYSQVHLFFKLLFDRTIERDALLYINTLLPFGAALYGKLTGRNVVYHIHEISLSPSPLKQLLTGIARWTSALNLYVSDTHMRLLPIAGVPAQRVYNALDEVFLRKASSSSYAHLHNGCFNVLMIASLRDYKGIPEFFALAARLLSQTKIRFVLVVNDEQTSIDRYVANRVPPKNITINPRTSDVSTFYNTSSLVLNLSRTDQWVETFGMTILEAMAYGIPVIVPPAGGPAELVEDGKQGFHVNSYDIPALSEKLLQLYNNEELCKTMSVAGKERARAFSPDVFAQRINEVISGVGRK